MNKTLYLVLFLVFGLFFTACTDRNLADLNNMAHNLTHNSNLHNHDNTHLKEISVDFSKINISDVCFPNASSVRKIFGDDADLRNFCILNRNESNNLTNSSFLNTSSNIVFQSSNQTENDNTFKAENSSTTSVNLNNSITLNDSNYIVHLDNNKVLDVIKSASYLKTIIINETDAVRLKINATDPDGDPLTISYSKPLDKEGYWKTKQGDKGEYIINLTVSDGKTNVSAKVRLIVLDLNLPPVLTIPSNITINEGQFLNITPSVYDVDNDSLNITYIGWLDQPVYNVTYFDAGTYYEKIEVSDGHNHTIIRYLTIKVINVNRPPQLNITPKLDVMGGETLHLNISVFDPDHDNLTITYSSPFDNNGTWIIPKFENGTFYSNISVSDGYVNITKVVQLNVKRYNTPPVITNDTLITAENTTINFLNFVKDAENDTLHLKVSGDLKDTLYYFDFNSSGSYNINLTACDYEYCVNRSIRIVVKNVDRLPIIDIAPEYTLTETANLHLQPVVTDLDGDNVSVKCMLNNTILDNCIFKTNYSSAGTYLINVVASDGIKNTTKVVKIIVLNKDRAPIIKNISNITVKEGQVIQIKPVIIDPDDDNVTWHLTGWLNKLTYTTNYNDSGVYNETLTATDGMIEVTKDFTITVVNVNRPPVILGVLIE